MIDVLKIKNKKKTFSLAKHKSRPGIQQGTGPINVWWYKKLDALVICLYKLAVKKSDSWPLSQNV